MDKTGSREQCSQLSIFFENKGGWGRGFCGSGGLKRIFDYDFKMIYVMAMITSDVK